MTTALLETAPPISKLASQLNTHLETQAPERALDRLDLCDRCPQAAQAVFEFQVEGGTTDIMLCGHHTRQHLPALLSKNPVSYWIEPSELYSIRGVETPERAAAVTGDGLTDA